MDDRTLESLKSIEVPPPSGDARKRALKASLSEFRAAKRERNNPTQGIVLVKRLMSIFNPRTWRSTMEKRMIIGTAAASLVVITVAGQWSLERGPISNLVPPLQLPEARDAVEPLAQPAPLPLPGPVTGERAGLPVATIPNASGDDGGTSSGTANTEVAAGEFADAGRQRVAEELLGGATSSKVRPAAPTAGGLVAAQQNQLAAPADRRLSVLPMPAPESDAAITRHEGRDQFADFEANPVKSVADEPVSTFSIDVDTASYAFVRRMLNAGQLPAHDAVRVEEMINYFSYDYPAADSIDEPFLPTVAVYPTPWNPNTKLLHVGIKGYEVAQDAKPHANLVFLIDVSGSMQSDDKLPLLKSAFRLLLDTLEADDTVAIVTYAGEAGTALEPTMVSERHKILAVIDGLGAGGSTAGAAGISAAYALAEQEFSKDGVNRVILATDGDFNVGVTENDSLEDYIEKKRESGVFLSVLGFGAGNYNDELMQVLAQNGNGNAAYIDTLNEARKVLVDEAVSTLVPIAGDVKIQVEFNPAAVAEYRLIGYETRALAREDFNNDRVDAGDIGAGHTVTAIYEITPNGSQAQLIDPLRYGAEDSGPAVGASSDEIGFLKLRYKRPGETTSRLIERAVTTADERASVDVISDDMRFAGAVAAFGQKLRDGTHIGEFDYDDIIALAQPAKGSDAYGYRAEFLTLVRLAGALDR